MTSGPHDALFKFVFSHPLKQARERPDLVELLARDWGQVVRDVAEAPRGLQTMEAIVRYILQVNSHATPPILGQALKV